jgi:hypothetical protein
VVQGAIIFSEKKYKKFQDSKFSSNFEYLFLFLDGKIVTKSAIRSDVLYGEIYLTKLKFLPFLVEICTTDTLWMTNF